MGQHALDARFPERRCFAAELINSGKTDAARHRRDGEAEVGWEKRRLKSDTWVTQHRMVAADGLVRDRLARLPGEAGGGCAGRNDNAVAADGLALGADFVCASGRKNQSL